MFLLRIKKKKKNLCAHVRVGVGVGVCVHARARTRAHPLQSAGVPLVYQLLSTLLPCRPFSPWLNRSNLAGIVA